MPRADEPRVTVRFGRVEHAALLEEARRRGVKVGTLVRDAAVAFVLPDEMGDALAAANARQEEKAERLRVALGGAPGVRTARELALERQARLNAAKDRPR